MQKQISVLVMIVCCFGYIQKAHGQEARIPETALVDITNTHIYLQFEWVGNDPEFQSDEAVEFEVIIITDNPKCFAQPLNGRDEDIRRVANNFPASHDLAWGYTDVWNYWEPPRNTRISEMEKYCGEIGGLCKAGLWSVPIADTHANFAVGTINPHNFKAGVRYWFFYPLERVNRPECQDRENRLAWVQINMTTFPNTCSLCQNPTQCVHLIGLETSYGIKCPEINDETRTRKSLIKRLCVNGDNLSDGSYPFAPDTGIVGGGACYDNDGDGYFRLVRDSWGNPLPMFGHKVGDCNDDPNDPESTNVNNDFYNEELGVCTQSEEILCSDGVDNDLDGLTDCMDPDCLFDPYCLISCTPICNPGQTRCNGNNVEICSADQCSYVFSYSCGSGEACVNGSCSPVTAPAPVISSVSCTSYQRGTNNVTCTIYGSNFNCGAGSNTFVADFYNGPAQTCTPTQMTVSGSWVCNQMLGFKQVSHRNPDNRRADRYDVLELVMGELKITEVWQQTVHQGATNVPMGANGCNFGNNVVFWVYGIHISNTTLEAENQVLATGTVTGTIADSPVDVCVAKYSGASIGFDKKCRYGYINIIP